MLHTPTIVISFHYICLPPCPKIAAGARNWQSAFELTSAGGIPLLCGTLLRVPRDVTYVAIENLARGDKSSDKIIMTDLVLCEILFFFFYFIYNYNIWQKFLAIASQNACNGHVGLDVQDNRVLRGVNFEIHFRSNGFDSLCFKWIKIATNSELCSTLARLYNNDTCYLCIAFFNVSSLYTRLGYMYIIHWKNISAATLFSRYIYNIISLSAESQ